MQLQLATGTQLLANFDATQLGTFKSFTAAVTGWLDAQQCSGKLTAEDLGKYSTVYHAIAAAIRPIPLPTAKISGVPPLPQATGKSPCADGHCPLPAQYQSRRRRG